MHVGVSIFASDWSTDIRDVARAAEDAGFESLFVPEHTHIPVSRATPYPAGGELPGEYSRCLDPFVALSAAAAVTERLRVGTGVCLVVERDPIHLAKEVATLDYLSGGRFLFGIGAGWNVEEMADHGTDATQRWEVMRDRVAACQALWTNDVASYDGPFARFEASWQWPKPVQTPHPPVMVGGGSKRAMRHAAEYGDTWMPIPDKAQGSMGERLALLAELAAAAGRPTPGTTAYAVTPKAEILAHYASMGIERCVLQLPPTGDALAVLKELAPLTRVA